MMEEELDVELLPQCAEEAEAASSGLYERRAKAVLLMTAFIDVLGFSMPNPLLPYVYSTEAGFSQQRQGLFMGLIMAVFSIGGFFSGVLLGRMSDRYYGRRLPILFCLFMSSIFLAWTGLAPNMTQLTTARGLAGAFAGTQGICSAYVMDLTTKEERNKELAHLASAAQIGFIAGPGIAIAIGVSFGIPRIATAFMVVCLLASAIAMCAFVLGLFFLKDPAVILAENNKTVIDKPASLDSLPVWALVWGLLKQFDLQMVFVGSFFYTLFGTFVEAVLPILLVREMSAPIWQVFLVFASMAIFTPVVTGVLYAPSCKRIGMRPTMLVALLLFGASIFFIPVFLLWYVQMFLVLGLAFASVLSPALMSIASYNSGHNYGTMMGILGTYMSMARMCGPLAAGWAYDVDFGAFIGRHRLLPFWMCSVFALVTAVCILFIKKTEWWMEESNGVEPEEVGKSA